MSKRSWLMTLLVLLLLALALAAADRKTGVIAGRLTDKENGAPIIGASVQVVGTRFGAMTDPDGNYRIARLDPGTYSLRFTSVEYATEDVNCVQVRAACTSTVNWKLARKVTDLDKRIECTANKDPIQKYETSNLARKPAPSIAKRPVQTVDACLKDVAGVQTTPSGQVYIRGGRAGEVAYISNGAPVGNPLAGNGYGQSYESVANVPLSHGGSTTVNGVPYDAMFFKHFGVNPFVDAVEDSLSTFAIDVDDASYILTRTYLESGNLPPAEAVRAEEFINHFSYEYPSPRREPFSIELEGGPSRFGSPLTWMLRVGIQGRYNNPAERKAANLVFVIDVSGSMADGGRLEMVKQALTMLVGQLKEGDMVGIVVYGSDGRDLLQPTSVERAYFIQSAIDRLQPGGSTYAEAGIRLGYAMANRNFDPHKLNRIILCSDGVANVGVTDADQMLRWVNENAKKGITLTTVGFGMGNYNDILMEKLGDKGNGHYAYVDGLDEAKRVFVDNLSGTLEVIARDAKIQVVFDPEMVRSYRLIGYENRDVADVDFRNDTVDGGEIGSGHRVTALYEIKLNRSMGSGILGKVQIRFKDDDEQMVREVSKRIDPDYFVRSFEEASVDFRLAATAAQFSEILRESYWAKGEKLSDVLDLSKSLYNETRDKEVAELVDLVQRANGLKKELSEK